MAEPERKGKKAKADQARMELFSYWRSSCSWRVRLVLELKSLAFEYKAVHLVRGGGEQFMEAYDGVGSMHQVPSLRVDGGTVIHQSLAIAEFLEETFPESPRLLPVDAVERATVRKLALMVAADTQPLQNLRVLKRVELMSAEENGAAKDWARYWIEHGLKAFEKELEKTAGKFCVGDSVTLADVCLVPQVYNARRFQVDMDGFPIINRVCSECEKLEAFKLAHPDAQPDCPDKTESK